MPEQALDELHHKAEEMFALIPAGSNDQARRCFALARTKLEESVMWASKGYITRDPIKDA